MLSCMRPYESSRPRLFLTFGLHLLSRHIILSRIGQSDSDHPAARASSLKSMQRSLVADAGVEKPNVVTNKVKDKTSDVKYFMSYSFPSAGGVRVTVDHRTLPSSRKNNPRPISVSVGSFNVTACLMGMLYNQGPSWASGTTTFSWSIFFRLGFFAADISFPFC